VTTWNRRVVVEVQDGRRWFTIREVYYDKGRIAGWTSGQAPGGETLFDLRCELGQMRSVLNKAPVLVERSGKLVAYRASGRRPPRSRPWRGRPANACTFTPGEIVQYHVRGPKVGIILAQPPTPEMAVRMQCDTTDDVYLVGLLDKDGSPRGFDHDHVAEGRMTLVLHLPQDIGNALEQKRRRHPRAETWRKEPSGVRGAHARPLT